MNTPAQDIKIILEANVDSSSHDLTFGSNMFIGRMPESPSECVSIADAPGLEPDVGPYYYDFVSVLIRGEIGQYVEAANIGQAMISTLHRYHGQPDSSSMYYTGIWCDSGTPGYIGTDENNRPMFSFNLRIQRR